MNAIYITESDEIYDTFGYVSKDMYEMWDDILETIPREKMTSKSWRELGLSDELTRIENEVWDKYKQQNKEK